MFSHFLWAHQNEHENNISKTAPVQNYSDKYARLCMSLETCFAAKNSGLMVVHWFSKHPRASSQPIEPHTWTNLTPGQHFSWKPMRIEMKLWVTYCGNKSLWHRNNNNNNNNIIIIIIIDLGLAHRHETINPPWPKQKKMLLNCIDVSSIYFAHKIMKTMWPSPRSLRPGTSRCGKAQGQLNGESDAEAIPRGTASLFTQSRQKSVKDTLGTV